MRESRVWKYLENKLPTGITAERFEVIHPPGMSDVLWTDTRTSISGWLELKLCEPTDREFVRGRIPKMKPEQPMFLRRQEGKGMPSGILLRVGEDMWVFWRARPDHGWVQDIRTDMARQMATHAWEDGSFSTVELFKALGCPCEV